MPTALIVDDEPEANRLLSMLVQIRGYRTESALTGGEALASIDRNPPDIVLLDLMLPDMKGFEVCEAVKTRKSTALIPVVMVTARIAADNRIESYDRGADHYVPKPYTPDDIFDALDDAVNWSHFVRGDGALSGWEDPFITDEVDETRRKLARLRSLLFARSCLDLRSVRAIEEALRSVIEIVEAWGRGGSVHRLADLRYQIHPDSVSLTLRDLAGWMREGAATSRQLAAELSRPGRFDQVSEDPSGGTVTLFKRCPPAAG